MSINSAGPLGGVTHALSMSATRSQMNSDMSRGFGPLSNSDIAMIQAATGTSFNWPPGEGEGFPAAADDLAMMKLRQMQQGSVIKDLTAADLTAARRHGIIDAEFLTKALDYLASNGQGNSTAERLSLKANRDENTQKTSATTKDGSLYL